jgi:hypothetical protein
MPSIRKNVSDTVRDITRKALSGGKVDQAALRRVTGELRGNLKRFERQLAKDLRAGKDAASGLLAGIADSLAAQKPHRKR